MADRPFARVYYVDLERDYPTVWRNDVLLSTYVRLLAVAEAMWPAVPEIPRSVSRVRVKRLMSLSLVKDVPPYGFRIKGMDAERKARSNAARNAAGTRWGNAAGNTPAMPSQPSQSNQPTRAPARRTNGEPIDEREMTDDQVKAAYIAAQSKRTGVS